MTPLSLSRPQPVFVLAGKPVRKGIAWPVGAGWAPMPVVLNNIDLHLVYVCRAEGFPINFLGKTYWYVLDSSGIVVIELCVINCAKNPCSFSLSPLPPHKAGVFPCALRAWTNLDSFTVIRIRSIACRRGRGVRRASIFRFSRGEGRIRHEIDPAWGGSQVDNGWAMNRLMDPA
jgi:hypothetical protein